MVDMREYDHINSFITIMYNDNIGHAVLTYVHMRVRVCVFVCACFKCNIETFIIRFAKLTFHIIWP